LSCALLGGHNEAVLRTVRALLRGSSIQFGLLIAGLSAVDPGASMPSRRRCPVAAAVPGCEAQICRGRRGPPACAVDAVALRMFSGLRAGLSRLAGRVSVQGGGGSLARMASL